MDGEDFLALILTGMTEKTIFIYSMVKSCTLSQYDYYATVLHESNFAHGILPLKNGTATLRLHVAGLLCFVCIFGCLNLLPLLIPDLQDFV